MMEAIRVGEFGRFTAPPNPWVGCVLANGGSIIGIGFHAKAGKPHAEIMAFLDAERKGNAHLIKGCTAYVTLEPCHHFGRTPPCDQEVLRRGVARCVVAIPDPDSRVDGKGLNLLQSNNIDIKVGVCQAEAEKSLAPYLHLRRTGRSYIVIKSACSLDGKIACSDGTSQWITGPESRARVHRIRAESQAIIVGSETAVTDNPMLNVRGVDFPAVNPTLETGTEVAVNEIYVASDLPLYSAGGDVGRTVKPLRVVLDARGRVTSGHLLDQTIGPTLIFTTHKAPKESLQAWEKAQVEVKLIGPGEEGGVDLKEVVHVLSSRGIIQILVEGGALIQNQFMASRLGNKLELFYGSCFIGHSGRPWAKLNFHENIKDVQFHTLESLQKLGNDVHLTYTLHHT
uniref:5-amino-6-(5-phosphoribosylamino)uracil reductase n=1 Tax=Arcella intermedia TaxID=1963864 RepID=A0A6B2L5Z4_9EUKA